ncbi:MAG: LamG-like jellyroll fold domain-containing protein [Cyanobacteriota bacterium]|nr:LamG-like jellyroll fold domain-containing protein [Cyanobacteriota bacterium]
MLSPLANLGGALNDPLSNGDLALSITAVIQAPSSGVVDANGFLVDFRLDLGSPALALRVAYDRRALNQGPERLRDSDPWQALINQWANPAAPALSDRITGVTPGSLIPLQIDLRLLKDTDPDSLVSAAVPLGYRLDGSSTTQPFGTDAAPLLSAMLGSPLQRQEAGSPYQLGNTASGTIGGSLELSPAPYIAAFVVTDPGRGYSDTDFVLEEASSGTDPANAKAAVVRGRLTTNSSGNVVSVAIFQTATAAAFASDTYLRLDDRALKARLSNASGGSDAQVQLSTANGRPTAIALATAADGKTALAGSGYLAGGTGRFCQWLNATAAAEGQSARVLLQLSVTDGAITAVSILRAEGQFADGQGGPISLSNSVAGDGADLALVPLLRNSLDPNLLDDSGLSIGSFQRYIDSAYSSGVDLVYTQGGPEASRAINSSLNLDTPLRVHRKDLNRGWINISIPDPQNVYTPGVNGYNFDTSTNTLFFGNDTGGGMRSVVVFSHANLSMIQNQRDLYLLEEALLQSHVYASLERKDLDNNLSFSKPQLLSDPAKGGSNSNAIVEPFYAVIGAGVAPVFDANDKLLAAWVHTGDDGQAEIQVRIATANGSVDRADSFDSNNPADQAPPPLTWSPIQSIALPPDTTGDDVTQLSLTYLDGVTPVLSWSLNSLTPYQAGVLQGDPTSYYRLNDLPSEGTLASIASTTLADGQLVSGPEVKRFSSWLDTSAFPLSQNEVVSTDGALLPPLDALSNPQIISGDSKRTPLQRLNDHIAALSPAHATAFGAFLGRSGINEQQINQRINTTARSTWITTYQELLKAFGADYDSTAAAIRASVDQQFVDRYGTRIKLRGNNLGVEPYDSWLEQGVADDYDLAVQQAINTQLGFDLPDSQRQSLLSQIATDFNAAVSSADPTLNQPGDLDLALAFSRGAFAELPNVFIDRLAGLNGLGELGNNEQPSGYSADLWVRTSVADGPGSILDNGLYNPNATLPSPDQLQLPVRLKRLAGTEIVNGVETNGYFYTLVVPAGSYASVDSEGLGSNLSPFNLRFAAGKRELSFSSSSSAIPSRTLSFEGADLADLVQYRTQNGKLSSFTLGDQDVILTSFFEPDSSSPGTTKEAKEFIYDAGKIGIESKQIPGWSLRKSVDGDKQYVHFNYGHNSATNQPATLSAPLPAGDWSHVAISYGEEQNLGSKLAQLFIDGELVAQAAEDPKALLGYDFNLLPYQLGYAFSGQLDELVLNDGPLTNPLDQLDARRITRYVDPRSAAKATFFSPGVFDPKTETWSWQPAGPFVRADYIPSTIPALVRGGPVDMAAANATSELRGDGQADLRASLTLRGMAIGSHITGIHARLVDKNGKDVDSQGKPYGAYAIGDGLRYGLDGKPSTVDPQGLIGVLSSGTRLNSGASGRELDFALMSPSTDLELFFPASSNGTGLTAELTVFQRSPLNRAQGGDSNFNLWRPSSYPQLTSSTTAAILSPYYSSKLTVQAGLQRTASLSLADLNTGFVASLAQTNEPTLADPSNQTYSEAIAAGTLRLITTNASSSTPPTEALPVLAIANPNLDGIGADGSKRGVIWVLRNDVKATGSTTAQQLQQLQRLVGQPNTALNEDANGLQGLVIVGRDGQKLGSSILWADLDRDGNDELILASPGSISSSGIPDSGSITVIRGSYLAELAASNGNRILDLSTLSPELAGANVRVLTGADGSEFGTALAYGPVLDNNSNGNALLIGAPGYVIAGVSTDLKGATIASTARQPASVGAIFLLKPSTTFFSDSNQPRAELLMDGDLPGLPNLNTGEDPTPRRFGASISLTAGKRDFNGDAIADIAIGIPGLVQARDLNGGIHRRASTEQREAELLQRVTMPDIYREGMTDEEMNANDRNAIPVQMGGVLLLAGGAANAGQIDTRQKVLLLGDTVFGDPAAAGSALASGGDFDNDDIDDLAIGSPEVDARTGAVSLVSGARIRDWFSKATPTNLATAQHSAFIDANLIIPNDQPNGLLGRSLALNGDVNADGHSDLVIGDPNYFENTGRVSVLFGTSNAGNSDLKISGQTIATSQLGSTTYHRLDLSNASTRLDIYPASIGQGLGQSILLANGTSSTTSTPVADLILPTSNGSSNLLTLYGKSRLKGLGSFSMGDLGSTAGIEIGDVLRRSNNSPNYGFLGDINGDGFADALVDLNSDSDRPRFKVSFGVGSGFSPDHQDSGTGGSSVLDLSDHLRILHPGATAFSLTNVESAGDLNADAISDLLISYSTTSNGRSEHRNAILAGGDLLTSNFLVKSALLSPIRVQGATLHPANGLINGDTLLPGQYLLSPNGRYMALMQSDGNFVVQAQRSDGSWSVSFSLDALTTKFYQGLDIGLAPNIPRTGSTPGTRLEIRNNAITFVNDQWLETRGGTRVELPQGGYYKRGDNHYPLTINNLPAGTTFTGLQLTDAGVLEAKASDGTILFSFEPVYASDLATAPIPAETRFNSDLFAPDTFLPIGTAITAVNNGAPTLLALAPERSGATRLRWLLQNPRAVDIAALFDDWFASFPAADTPEEQAEITSFNNLLKQELLAFDPTAVDADTTSARNLDTLTAMLEVLAANAGSSFRTYVEGRSPVLFQPAISLLQTYGDPPSLSTFIGDTPPPQSGDVLLAGQRMRPGDYLLSPNGRHMALMQSDGNFVVQALNSQGTWNVSFSLNDYRQGSSEQLPVPNVNNTSIKLGTTPGTSLLLKDGKLAFSNPAFQSADGTNAFALTSGIYRRFGDPYNVTVTAPAAGTSLSELRLGDDGILRAIANDGTVLFNFQSWFQTSDTTPIPDDKLQGLRKVTNYEQLNLAGRDVTLIDRNGDGVQELLIGPNGSDPSWYQVPLTGSKASTRNTWFATPLPGTEASAEGSFLWSSTGEQPANLLSPEQANTSTVRSINGYSSQSVFNGEYSEDTPDQPVATGGYFGVNGASLSRPMLHLGGLNAQNSWGQYSQRLGGSDLQRRLQQQAESFELKVPAYVWQMKSKGDGTPENQGGDELVLHIGSGSGIKDRLGNTADATINLDGLAISFNEYNSRIRLFWNGKNIGEIGADTSFMEPDGGLHNNTGIDKGYELMSVQRNWFSNLFTTGLYIRVQQQPFEQGGKTYQARLIMELANGMRYLPYESGTWSNTPRLNSLNKGVQISIPLETGIQFNSTDLNLNAYGWSGAYQGLHALAGVEFNTDKPIEGTNLQRLKPIGDLNGDGYTDMIGMGSLATGWNYDYALDLPNNNLTRRSGGSTSDEETDFTLNNGANGNGISRSVIHSPTIVWGGPDGVNTNQLTPIVRGSRVSDFYPASGKTTTTAQLDQVQLSAIDNFSAADNVHYVPLGDVNGDGFDDVAIADYGANGSAYILYGGTGLQSASSYLDRFRSFLPETRAKDSNILPIQDAESPNIYLSSNPTGFGIDNSGNSVAWINAINLEHTATQSNSKGLDPAFGAVVVTKIAGFTGQQLADLSAAGDFNADGLADLFLTSQSPYNSNLPLDQQPPSRYVLFGGDFTGAYTITGTANSDSLKGTAANDVIVSFAGNDIIQTKGGMDAVNAGPGDDQIYLDDDQFRRIDGGSGYDTLILQGQRNQAWDFTKLASASRLRGIESIVLSNYGANAVTLNAAAVRAISGNGSLMIDGDLQTTTPLENVAEALALRLKALDTSSGGYKALVDFASRLLVFNFSNADLSLIPNLLIDSQRDHLFDQLRAFAGDTGPRPLAALRTRLELIEAAAPSVIDSNGDITIKVPDLVSDFIDSFSQSLAFTHSSILDAYQEWFQTLAFRSPETFALLGSQQLADLIALPASWRAAYPTYFNTDGTATPPADLAFERFLDSPNAPASISEAYQVWLSSNAAAYSAAQLPPSSDPRHNELRSQLSDLQAMEGSLLQSVLNTFDSLRLSAEFSLTAADITVGSATVNEYSAYGGSVRLLVPDSIAVLMDAAVPSTLTPTPPTRSSASLPTPSNTNLEADPTTGISTTAAPVAVTASPSSYADLRITASEPVLSDDGRFLVFSLHRSGHLDDTTRLLANTDGYIADAVPSYQGQVVFSPGETTQQLRISRMQQLPHELAAINPYDNPLAQSVSLSLALLPQHSNGPRTTAGFTLNALNAYTPELNSPSRPLPSAALNRGRLFSSNLSFQLDSALWMTAESINDEPIRFALDNPQGLALNDIQLLDRNTGTMTSIINAAWAGEATIYGDNYLSPSSDLYFSITDGGRFDQDGRANGQITLAAAGARTSPGTVLVNSHVLRAPSSNGLTLLASPQGQQLTGELAAAKALWLIPTDDTSGNLRQTDGSLLARTASDYLAGLLARASDPAFAPAVAQLDLNTGASTQPLHLSNDTNYVAVLSLAQPGTTAAATDLRLVSLQSGTTTAPNAPGAAATPARAVQTLNLTVGDQTRSLVLSSPYFLVPGLEGTQQLLSTQLQQAAGAEPLHLAWLRVDDVAGSGLDALIRSADLSSRLTTVPKSGIVSLTAGDMLLPLVLRGITAEAWAELPPAERIPSATDSWDLELADPGRMASPLLQRAGTNDYSLAGGGRLVISPAPLLSASDWSAGTRLADRLQLTGQASRGATASIGYYRSADANGSVLDRTTGQLLSPSDPGYAAAALAPENRINDPITNNDSTNPFNGATFLAPYATIENLVIDPSPIPSTPARNGRTAAAGVINVPAQPIPPTQKATSNGGRFITADVFAFPEANPSQGTFFRSLPDSSFALQTNIRFPHSSIPTDNLVLSVLHETMP